MTPGDKPAKKLKPMKWTLALRDEPEWRAMGCPTMRAAMDRIKQLETRVKVLEGEHDAAP